MDTRTTDQKTVVNMVNRIQSRNTGYSDGLFPKNTNIESNTLSSIHGATALKLNEKIEISERPESVKESDLSSDTNANMVSGVSIESASYIENNTETNIPEIDQSQTSIDDKEEFTPQLFSDEVVKDDSTVTLERQDDHSNSQDDHSNSHDEKLFDQDINEDEENFEIPAFLRRQKF